MRPTALDAAGFAGLIPVSRETLERLGVYLDLLRRWQRAINLVAASTLDDPWRRHVLDSAQLHPLLPTGASPLVDLGSGAGLPGLVLAIMGVADVHLVESDQRKAAFLREAARTTGTPVTVHPCRIEAAPPLKAGTVTARALAPLPQLMAWAQPFLRDDGVCLFLKGRQAEAELTDARRSWTMEVTSHPSQSDAEGRILIIRGIERAGA